MSNFTQTKNTSIDFRSLLEKCHNFDKSLSGAFTHQILILLAITTGLDMELIMNLRWKDILILGSDNDTVAKKNLDDLKVRKYLIPIHEKVGILFSQIHAEYFHPKLERKIIDVDCIDRDLLLNSPESYTKMAILIFTTGSYQNRKLFDKINIDTYTRVVFGRRVLEVNGYSNEVSKQLKNHFRIKTNRELFNFLGYTSSKEIKYNLSDIKFSNNIEIPVVAGDEEIKYCNDFIKLEDKNFYNNYPFQKFSAFSKFMFSKDIHISGQSTVNNSIWLLLLISLYNGVRISKLLDLKWKDIMEDSSTEDKFEILSSINLDNYTIKITEAVKNTLACHSKPRAKKTFTAGTFSLVYYEADYKSKPKLDSPIFITNTGKALTQNSLSREIKSAFKSWQFPHADKFTSKSTLIMWGRRIIEIRGDHKPTIKALKRHFNFKSQDELFNFLCIDYKKEVRGKTRNILFEEILYDL